MARNKPSIRILAVFLSAMILAGLLPAGTLAAEDGKPAFTWEKTANDPAKILSLRAPVTEDAPEPLYKDTDVVRVSVVLDDASAMEAGLTLENAVSDPEVANYRRNLRNKQDLLARRISTEVLEGRTLDVVWNLTLAANVISANVEYGKLGEIKAMKGIRDVILETRFEPAVVSRDAVSPNMAVASSMVGGGQAWANGCTGAGSAVAIIDTGLDTDHELFQPEPFAYALEKDGLDVELMTADDIGAVWDQLNAAAFLDSPDGVYLNTKVPFAVNYIDRDLEVQHITDTQSEHGSHVAGIAAGNRYIAAEGDEGTFVPSLPSVYTQGEAPDAQILVMKVFGKEGGAFDSDYMAALEDAIVLGADCVNLSLGSTSPGFVKSDGYQDIMDSLVGTDAVVAISMGNAFEWSNKTAITDGEDNYIRLPYLYSDKHNFMTGGSPGSFTNSLAVASVDNDGRVGEYLIVGGENVFYTDSTSAPVRKFSDLEGELEYIYIDSTGEASDYAAVGDVTGKVVLVNRGAINFTMKGNNAAKAGAAAVIVVDNEPGVMRMIIDGYGYTVPFVSVTLEDGLKFKAAGEETELGGITCYLGTFTAHKGVGSIAYDSDTFVMSDFSSWGVPGDLSLKPEITAPGGSIRSVWGKNNNYAGGSATDIDNQYELMSGTSMAAPQITGLSAVLAQYIRENDLVEKTGLTRRALIQSLLMSTSVPLIEGDSGSYYSILKQGAGLADAEAAMAAKAYILMEENATPSWEDGKVKAELGDDPDRTGEYEFSFTLNSLTDKAVEYDFSAAFFTQDIFAHEGAEYFDLWTVPVTPEEVTYTIDDVLYVPEEIKGLDFNGDGVFNARDAVAVLELNVNGTPLADDTGADFNEDGAIDTYDAYLALKYATEAEAELPVEGRIRVTVRIRLSIPEELDVNGNYIEGYIFVTEKDTEEGVRGVRHSIPVFGYYGSWTEFNSSDVGSYWDYQALDNATNTALAMMQTDEEAAYAFYMDFFKNFGGDDREPMLGAANPKAYDLGAFTVRYAGEISEYPLGGNPLTGLEADGTYHPERNAINNEDGSVIGGYRHALIRNAADIRFQILDESGAVLDETEIGSKTGAYYDFDGKKWFNISTTDKYGKAPRGAEELSRITVTHTVAPEYYVGDDGSVDWDSVHENSTDSIGLTIDNTAPVLSGMKAGYDNEKQSEGILFDVEDNFYIAGIVVYNEEGWLNDGEPIYAEGADLSASAPEKRSVFLTPEDIDTSAEGNDHLMIVVVDYAMNMVTYKLSLNGEELGEGVQSLSLDPEFLRMIPNSTAGIRVNAQPWGTSDEVTWSSSDKSVATVGEDGVVTAVDEGTCTITATSVENPSVSAACTVFVTYVEINLNAAVWDEDGNIDIASFNTKDIINGTGAYKKLASTDAAILDMAYDMHGETIYVTALNEFDTSDLYTLDPTTLALEYIGTDPDILFVGMAPSYLFPLLTHETTTMVSIIGSYLVGVDTATGTFDEVLPLSGTFDGDWLVGISYIGSFYDMQKGTVGDRFFLVDNTGCLYLAQLYFNISSKKLGFEAKNLGQIGSPVEMDYMNSLYFDGTNVFWSRFSSRDENKVDLIMVEDVFNTGTIHNLGSFNESVWPVAGLIELGGQGTGASFAAGRRLMAARKAPVKRSGLAAYTRADEFLALTERDNTVELLPAIPEDELVEIRNQVNGGLHGVPAEGGDEPAVKKIAFNPAYVLKVRAENAENNGLVTVEYDAEVLTLISADSSLTYNVINREENGKVVIGFATLTAVEKDGVIATLRFRPRKDGVTEAAVSTDQAVDPKTGESLTPSRVNVQLGEERKSDAPAKTDPRLPTIIPPISGLPLAPIKDNRPTREPVIRIPGQSGAAETPVIPVVSGDLPFNDVSPSDSFYGDVKFVYENGIMNGISAVEFAPNATLTRAMVVTILYRVEGEPAVEFKGVFTDVEAGTWYSEAVEWAAANGIVNGYGNGRFGPVDAVTLEQLAAILNRYAEFKGYEINVDGIAAAGEVSPWAVDNVNWAVANGILAGVSSYVIPALRSQVAAAIHAFCVNAAK